MVREARLAWNDPDEHDQFRNLPPEDDTDDWDESPLEPPPKRRCSRRQRKLAAEMLERNDPATRPEPPPNPPDRSELS